MRQRVLSLARGRWDAALVVLITLGVIWFRLTAYGDLRLSIATLDTESYMQSARAPLLSWQAFVGERLFATNALYSAAGAQDCPIQAISVPAIGKESHRQDQACFDVIVLTQVALSVIGWGLFVIGFSLALTSSLARIVAAVLLSIFAFVPQIADWDSILNSQSLAFSVLALALGFVLLALRTLQTTGLAAKLSIWTRICGAAGILSLVAWSFVRDPNVYAVGLFAVMLLAAGLLVRPKSVEAIISGAVLIGLCVVGMLSSLQSERWKVPLTGAYEQYVLSSPDRVVELERLGMPEPGSAEYAAWFDRSGASSYAFLMVRHPRFVISTIFENINYLFSDNNQPYFKTPDLPLRNFALQVGDWVQPRSIAVILAALISFVAVGYAGMNTRQPHILAWAWLLGWLLLSALATTVLTFFADPAGVERHVLLSLVLLRLLMWMGLLVLVDLSQSAPARTQG